MIPSRRILLSAVPAWVLKGAAIDLDFANQRYYKGSPTDSLSTSRASTGYAQDTAGVLYSFAANTPRITNQGLLIEEARTNLNIQSQDLGTSWTPAQTTVSTEVAAAPDGTTTADSLTDTAGTNLHSIASTVFSVVSATVYTHSVYAKSGTDSKFQLTFSTGAFSGVGYADFDLSAGTVSATGGTLVGSGIQALANGWYRCWIVATATANSTAAANLVRINTTTAVRVVSYAGTATTVIFWGSQVEAGSFPTSYIPTTTVSVTRAADGVTLAGGLQTLVANPPLSLVFKTPPNAAFVVSTSGLIGYHSANNGIRGGVSTASATRFNSVTVSATIGGSGTYIANTVKTGASWDTASESIVANDGTVGTGSNAPTTGATIDFGSMNGSNTYWNSYIARASFWNSRLPDATLKTFTV